jgi:hypothetical protein
MYAHKIQYSSGNKPKLQTILVHK